MKVERPFTTGDSFVHRLDPRVKVLAAVAFSATAAALRRPTAAGAALLVATLILLVAHLDARAVAKRLALANVFVGAAWLFLPWSVPGEPALSLGAITLTQPGIQLALLITLKCNAILIAIIALIATSDLSGITHALKRLHVPETLLTVLSLCIRHVSIISTEFLRLTQAMRIRAFNPRPELRTYRTYANLLGTLVVRSHDRAERVQRAMLCRGFSGTWPLLREPRLRAADLAATLVMLVFITTLVVLEWMTTT